MSDIVNTPGQLSRKSLHLATVVKSADFPKTKWWLEENASLTNKLLNKFLWKVWKSRKMKA